MTDVSVTPANRVDQFVIALASQLRIAGPKSHEGAVAAALLLLGDRLQRDFGPDDIARLASQMREAAEKEYEAILMRAKFALPVDTKKREVIWR